MKKIYACGARGYLTENSAEAKRMADFLDPKHHSGQAESRNINHVIMDCWPLENGRCSVEFVAGGLGIFGSNLIDHPESHFDGGRIISISNHVANINDDPFDKDGPLRFFSTDHSFPYEVEIDLSGGGSLTAADFDHVSAPWGIVRFKEPFRGLPSLKNTTLGFSSTTDFMAFRLTAGR